jgi:hypothetical protein
LAPGPLVHQGCTLQMDSQQCLIQCPNCQPIRCPINSQGLYLLPATATAYHTIDVDEYIDRANQARFAAAAMGLSEHHSDALIDDDTDDQARFAAAALALADDDEDSRTFSTEPPETATLSEQVPDPRESTPRRSNVSPHWTIGMKSRATMTTTHRTPPLSNNRNKPI